MLWWLFLKTTPASGWRMDWRGKNEQRKASEEAVAGGHGRDGGGWTRVVARGWKERTGRTRLHLLTNWM